MKIEITKGNQTKARWRFRRNADQIGEHIHIKMKTGKITITCILKAFH